jgi:glycosyltransferase involved in cell wall biosynthesis
MISILIPNRNEPFITDVMSITEKYFPKSEIIVATDRNSRGKGWAIRTALEHAKGDIIVFLDGDMDIRPREILKLMPFLIDYDIVVGKKELPSIPSRMVLTFLSRLFIRMVFGIKVDTQTGVKIFRRKSLPAWETNSFAFDIEILYKARKNGSQMVEVPVKATISRKMTGSAIFKTFVESMRIWWRY